MKSRFRLQKIDESMLGDHYFLNERDSCYFYGQYVKSGGEYGSRANKIIYDLKFSGNKKTRYGAQRKIADHIIKIANLEEFTVVPIPPSKKRNDKRYDPRLIEILDVVKDVRPDIDIREAVNQNCSFESDHSTNERVTISELETAYVVDRKLLHQAKSKIVIFDDVVTSGKHYLAMKKAIMRHRKDVRFKGLFFARRVLR